MAEDLEAKKPKTEVVGTLTEEAASALKGWDKYKKSAEDLTKARAASEKAKNEIRNVLLKTLERAKKTLNDGTRITEDTDVDFTVQDDRSVRVFVNLDKGKGRARSKDLSTLFSGGGATLRDVNQG
jgi:hypothetical protein